jgi:hypothetical protein
MLFSEAELICFNSVLDGKRIFGTHFQVPEDVSKEYIDKTMEQLIEHKFLDDNKKPNESFFLALKVLNEYKEAGRYLIMNQMKIAFAKDEKNIICLGKMDDGYEMTAMKKELFLYEYMKKIPFLAEEDTNESKSSKIEYQKWFKELENPSLKYITFLQEFNQNKLGKMYILYEKENQGYLYEPAMERIIQGGSLQFRHLLMNLFQISMGELYHERKH